MVSTNTDWGFFKWGFLLACDRVYVRLVECLKGHYVSHCVSVCVHVMRAKTQERKGEKRNGKAECTRTHRSEVARPSERVENAEMSSSASNCWQFKRLATESISALDGDSHNVARAYIINNCHIFGFHRHFGWHTLWQPTVDYADDTATILGWRCLCVCVVDATDNTPICILMPTKECREQFNQILIPFSVIIVAIKLLNCLNQMPHIHRYTEIVTPESMLTGFDGYGVLWRQSDEYYLCSHHVITKNATIPSAKS